MLSRFDLSYAGTYWKGMLLKVNALFPKQCPRRRRNTVLSFDINYVIKVVRLLKWHSKYCTFLVFYHQRLAVNVKIVL